MNILLVTTHFPPMKGGVESATESFLDFLERTGINSYTLTYDNSEVAQQIFSDHWVRSEILRIKIPYALQRHMIDLRCISETPRGNLLYKTRYVLLHEYFLLANAFLHFKEIRKSHFIVGQGAVIESMCAYILSKLLGKKYILRLHIDITLFLSNTSMRRLFRKILSKADKIIVNSKDIKEGIVDLGIPHHKLSVSSFHIANEIFYPRDKVSMRAKHGLPTEELIVIFVGALNSTKLCDFALQVTDYVLEKDKTVNFVFIGEGPLEREVCELQKRHYRNVFFTNKMVSKETLAEYLAAADVFLLGSVDTGYPSRLVLECLACGTPVIIPNVSIYPEKRKKKIFFKINLPSVYIIDLDSVKIATFIVNNKDLILSYKENTEYKKTAHNYILKHCNLDEVERYCVSLMNKVANQ